MNAHTYHIISISLAVISFLIIVYVGLKTDILREKIPNLQLKYRMFSLGRFQLWIWTLIICPAFILYWGFSATHGIDLNTTGVILLGIPAGVAITSSVISGSQASDLSETDHVNAEAAAQNSQNATAAHINAVSGVIDPSTVDPNAPAVSTNKPPVVLKMHQKSKSFFIDLISDDSGQLSLGRLQQFIFTLVFIVIYSTTFFGAKMSVLPDFGAEVFALMGISSGTYLVSKGMNK